VKFYAKAQSALQETFLQPSDSENTHALMHHPLLKDIKLETLILKPKSKGINKFLSELKLRTITGAIIIGVERNDESIVNPKADFELAEGDLVLLLGYDEQISAAKEFLNSMPEKKLVK
jgi:K+/H+ antiporter YhaU regulatory subunit KhtT